MKSKLLLAVTSLLLAAAALNGQTPVYYSSIPPDCSRLGTHPVAIPGTSGTTLGYSCYVSGTFSWFVAGAGWLSSIRVAAPASGAVFVDYSFYDESGAAQSLDSTAPLSSSSRAGSESAFVLSANQPAAIDLLGVSGTGPNYTQARGSVYTVIYCAEAATCAATAPQLLYSAPPDTPWSISVPIVWDQDLSAQWSAEGVDNGSTNRLSLAIYNAETTATAYTIRVYDRAGALVGSATTPPVAPLQPLSGGYYGEGGTLGFLLSEVFPGLPAGVFKLVVDGGTQLCAVEVLQFSGASATSLQVSPDPAPTRAGAATAARRTSARRVSQMTARGLFQPSPR